MGNLSDFLGGGGIVEDETTVAGISADVTINCRDGNVNAFGSVIYADTTRGWIFQ